MTHTNFPSGQEPDSPGPDAHPAEDSRLLAALERLLDDVDPVPDGLTERVRFAMDLRDLDVEVARWERLNPVAGVRGRSGPSTITFTVEDLTVMVSLSAAGRGYRFDGWLVPGGPHMVEVRVDGHDSTTTTADEDGRFALADVPRGLTQILVHCAPPLGRSPRVVATPTIVL